MDNDTLAADDRDAIGAAPLGGTRAQALHRLQVGVSLLIGIVLIVGLASVIEERAKQSDETVVPAAAATATSQVPAPGTDPLADAGVVPDLPDVPAAPERNATDAAEPGGAR
ncbi:hypothetical protein GRI40_05075 [Altererythrobacter aerius]|uniref:Uncharacterized protein n=1 Tax=Tsuneonella aeria TaxID=1837929 RepID=A0A6I4TCU1_9SPHN|nr:hypothetical protein [Tsuneonella aeria]MXO74594.1 hypothetical protein [Tsuneonella aeria]